MVEPQLAGAILLAVRWFVALRLQPHLGLAIGRAWWPTSIGLALLLAATLSNPGVALVSADEWVLAVVTEVLFGAGLGVVVSVPAYALLGGATASAVALRTVPAPLLRMCVSGALVAALAMHLHHPALVALRDQVRMYPPGRPASWLPQLEGLPETLAVQLDGALMLALTLATPVLLCVVVLRVVGAVAGAGPQVGRPFSAVVGPALATLGALLALAASWSVYPQGWARAAMGG